MDQTNQINDIGTVNNNGTSGAGKLSQVEYENRKNDVQTEMERMNKLPSGSIYASHRIKVLNKILHLLSIPRTMSQEEELELLFAGLSL